MVGVQEHHGLLDVQPAGHLALRAPNQWRYREVLPVASLTYKPFDKTQLVAGWMAMAATLSVAAGDW